MDAVVICTISCHSKVAFVCTTMFICSKQIPGRSDRWPVFSITLWKRSYLIWVIANCLYVFGRFEVSTTKEACKGVEILSFTSVRLSDLLEQVLWYVYTDN